MTIVECIKYGLILGISEIVLLIISTFGMKKEDLSPQKSIESLAKFVLLNVIFVIVMDKVL